MQNPSALQQIHQNVSTAKQMDCFAIFAVLREFLRMLYAFDSSRNCVVFAYPNICKRTCFYFGVSRLFSDRCAVISGLGVSPTSIWYFRSLCGAKYNACYFCCAMAHIFSPELISLLRLSMLRQRIRGANATSLTAASVGGISLTLQRDALNHHRCQYSKLVRRRYCAVWAAV